MSKICSSCQQEKLIIQFSCDKSSKDGKMNRCKPCIKEYKKQYYILHRQEILNKTKKNYKNNPLPNLERAKSWYIKNTIHKKEYDKEYYILNKDKKSQQSQQWYINNKEIIIENNNKYAANRYIIDPVFRLRNQISGGINKALHKNGARKNNQSIFRYLPYSFIELCKHLELLFEPWMNWDNYGSYRLHKWNDSEPATWTWQLDHIIPQSRFIYNSMSDSKFIECWKLSNLQPLSSKANLLKGNK